MSERRSCSAPSPTTPRSSPSGRASATYFRDARRRRSTSRCSRTTSGRSRSCSAGHIDVAWNTPLAHVRVQQRTDGRSLSLGMRDSDRDFHAKVIVRRDAGIRVARAISRARPWPSAAATRRRRASCRCTSCGRRGSTSSEVKLLAVRHRPRQARRHRHERARRAARGGRGPGASGRGRAPTHSYMRMLYKYPQAAFPYAELVDETEAAGCGAPEYELLDTCVFGSDRYSM